MSAVCLFVIFGVKSEREREKERERERVCGCMRDTKHVHVYTSDLVVNIQKRARAHNFINIFTNKKVKENVI